MNNLKENIAVGGDRVFGGLRTGRRSSWFSSQCEPKINNLTKGRPLLGLSDVANKNAMT
jgi:hypothetical protein